MRTPFLVFLLLTSVAAGTYWYQSTAAICPVPLSYRLGEINSSFELSHEVALMYVQEAESRWEEQAGRDLFVYDETSDFLINFIYDERQHLADTEASERIALDAQRAESEMIILTVEKLQAEHHALSLSYDARVSEYEDRLSTYNMEVNRYNDRGGAPPDVYEDLEAERVALRQEVDDLAATAVQLNNLATEINELGQRGNDLVEDYNQQVNQYNTEFGFAREFTQGDYQGDSIQVYKFSNDNELIKVLMHEFGHTLGINHVAGESSVMYYLLENSDQQPELSTEDMVAFKTVCGDKETIGGLVRRLIRELL